MTRLRKKEPKTPEDFANWEPPGGIFGPNYPVRKLEDGEVVEAAKLLGLTNPSEIADLKQRLSDIAINYWGLEHEAGKPPQEWYRQETKSLQEAIERLLFLIRNPPGASLMGLGAEVQRRLERPLRGMYNQESVESILDGLRKICEQRVLPGQKGAKKLTQVRVTVAAIADIWQEIKGKPVGVSLTREPAHKQTGVDAGDRRVFVYPGPWFVQYVMQHIDPSVSTAHISTALRSLPRTRRRQR